MLGNIFNACNKLQKTCHVVTQWQEATKSSHEINICYKR
jgi:hypothetical protein